ncbi:MAG TPA: alpha/beta hydrolase-fold protein [Phycisphaerae bacterium]|mgnify:CR=1 FL=1|nr:esterase family protein [Phycisphaerae bacterium]HOI55878.1 alpha/beta hydrolase-fold protein [Phycisphaerae bacterium]
MGLSVAWAVTCMLAVAAADDGATAPAPAAAVAAESEKAASEKKEEAKTMAPAPDEDAKTVETSPEGCRIEKFTVWSPSMKRRIQAVVVLPPGYDDKAATTYPILYTLHGAHAPYATWSDMSMLRRALKHMPMIVTCFNGDDASMYLDSTTTPTSQFTTFFFDEFVPHIDAHYRVDTGRRGVTGFSMGGFGAMHYMLTRPEMFRSVSGLSSAYGAVRGTLMASKWLGPKEENQEAYDRCDIFKRIADYVAAGRKLPPIYQHCGTEDFLIGANREFRDFLVNQNARIRDELKPQVDAITDARQKRAKTAELMAARQIDFTFVESPGAHNWDFWHPASVAVVEFHWRSFQQPAKR